MPYKQKLGTVQRFLRIAKNRNLPFLQVISSLPCSKLIRHRLNGTVLVPLFAFNMISIIVICHRFQSITKENKIKN